MMKSLQKPLAAAVLIALAQLANTSFAATPEAPAASAPAAAASAAKAPVALKPTTDWVRYDDTTFTPVADEVSRRLLAAAVAFDAKDQPKAAAELRAVADALKGQAEEAAKHPGKNTTATEKRLQSVETRLEQAATSIEQGKLTTRAQFDAVFDKAVQADLDSRWIETDIVTWYPVSEEPQRHFSAAAEAFAKKDYQLSAEEMRKAAGFVRLEAGRASGAARRELAHSVSELDKLAAATAQGTVQDKAALQHVFARADRALALAHRTKAAEAWSAKAYDKAGYELKAAAHGLDSAANWTSAEAAKGASAAVSDARSAGDKLASGAAWTRDEIAKGFASLGHGLDELGRKIDPHATTQKGAGHE